MAINEEISGNTPSAATNPTTAVSDIVIEGSGKGHIFTEVRVPGGDWVVVTDAVGSFSMDTNDTTLEYRFRPSNVIEPTRVYMGP
jgi:hypothetical protein